MTLEERIEEAKRRLRERTPPPPESREELNIQAVARIDDSLPVELRPFVVYGGEKPDPRNPETWLPTFFKIETPRLAPMAFTTVAVEGSNLVKVNSIRVGGKKFGVDWDAAIVAAAGETRGR